MYFWVIINVNLFEEAFWSSYTRQNVLNKNKQRCSQQETPSNKTSNESHLY